MGGGACPPRSSVSRKYPLNCALSLPWCCTNKPPHQAPTSSGKARSSACGGIPPPGLAPSEHPSASRIRHRHGAVAANAEPETISFHHSGHVVEFQVWVACAPQCGVPRTAVHCASRWQAEDGSAFHHICADRHAPHCRVFCPPPHMSSGGAFRQGNACTSEVPMHNPVHMSDRSDWSNFQHPHSRFGLGGHIVPILRVGIRQNGVPQIDPHSSSTVFPLFACGPRVLFETPLARCPSEANIDRTWSTCHRRVPRASSRFPGLSKGFLSAFQGIPGVFKDCPRPCKGFRGRSMNFQHVPKTPQGLPRPSQTFEDLRSAPKDFHGLPATLHGFHLCFETLPRS